jgi:hypothetical protein
MKEYKFEINGSNKYWYKGGKKHRERDKPAMIWSRRSKWWYWNGKLHREGDKPAMIYWDGTEEYWENGERIDK